MTLVGIEPKQFALLNPQQYQLDSTTVTSARGNVIVSNTSSTTTTTSPKVKSASGARPPKRPKLYPATAPYSTPVTQSQQSQQQQQQQQPQPSTSVARRNARERNRVKQVNNGFATLRQHIPQSLAAALGGNTAGTQGGARAGSKKLSKVETLRMAVEYIRNLQQLLDDHDLELSSSLGSPASSPPSSTASLSPASSGGSDVEQPQQQYPQQQQQQVTHQQQQQQQQQQVQIKYEMKCESSDEEYQQQMQMHQQQYQLQHQSPVYAPAPQHNPCSEASSSPTPSYGSEASSVGGANGQTAYGNFHGSIYATTLPAHGGQHGPYDGYEPMSPEDEELLANYITPDYITLDYIWPQHA